MGNHKLFFMNVFCPETEPHTLLPKSGGNDINFFPLGHIPKSPINWGKSLCNTLITADTLESQKSEVMNEKQSTKSFSELTVSKFTPIKKKTNDIRSIIDIKAEINNISRDPSDYSSFCFPSQIFCDINSKMNQRFEEELEGLEEILPKLVAAANESLTDDYQSSPVHHKVRQYFELPKEYSMTNARHSEKR